MPPIPLVTQTLANGRTAVFLSTVQNAVPYIELLDYQEHDSLDDHTSTRICICRWQDRQLFKTDMMGYGRYLPGTVVGGAQTNLHRQPPEQHPEIDYLYASSCDLIEGMGIPPTPPSSGLNIPQQTLAVSLSALVNYGSSNASMRDPVSNLVAFNLAKFRVAYSAVTWDIYSDTAAPAGQAELGRMVDRKWQFAAENVSVAGGSFQYVGFTPKVPLLEPPARLSSTMNLIYTWKAVPLLFNRPLAGLGKVNSTTFDGIWPPGTCLLTTVDNVRYRDSSGNLVWDYIFNYLYRNNGTDAGGYAKGHSYIFKAGGTNDWTEVSTDGLHYDDSPVNATKKIYGGYDHNSSYRLP